ncbi:histidine phosphatase family protein [Cryobacterium sinapicolor]|uniref:Histidine phosphatase family protein n=1 Tax=Cryobacterium sinapicolor TaxID=1259236 RepID=A0ABY2JGR6_9MICO|nr:MULTISPECIES: histidine phosphatase family protein [Cryobacterium]TFC25920.1 histidine phosphatase family protein [Cryobacterium sp. TMT2-18-2]TFC32475.1 histidine phosphatase family protein [Cryobacterium sp. TMT2-42-4]TFC59109.1 histidine phosphatase family protein [Cryobacterium sp. TMT2-15-1]TFC65354.1 histidine phosphatase family protein [Cryobacterium sp. TMT2-18-3]TFC93807.1 histidine phosphatase family protein [Cryobacterium sp. TMT3-29-2]
MHHYIYLVRHGEQQDAEHGMPDGPLSARGTRQAQLIAERLGGVPFTDAWHSPLQRAADTAKIIAQRLPALTSVPSPLLFDCIPSGRAPETPSAYAPFFGGVTEADIEAGSAQMGDAVAEFLQPRRGERHDLLITHNFVIAWFVREVLGAPDWRWISINQANCGLTVLHQKPGRPWTLLTHNDTGHLPVELRTGLPDPLLF